jgi:hypothetical protein
MRSPFFSLMGLLPEIGRTKSAAWLPACLGAVDDIPCPGGDIGFR